MAAARCAAAEAGAAVVDDTEVTRLLGRLREHLRPTEAGDLERLRVQTAQLADEAYAFALPGTASPPGSSLDPEQAALLAQHVVLVKVGASSLAVAVAIWLGELRAALGGRPPGLLSAIPTERDQLPAALEAAFDQREREVDLLLAEVCPGLAEPVHRKLGRRGFHAIVLPPQSYTVPVSGGIDVVEHPVVFSFNAADRSVRLAGSVDREFVTEPSTQASCENWLSDSPAQAALKDVSGALSRLLPGFGA